MADLVLNKVARPNRECDPDYSKDFNVVGKSGVRRIDGYEKASGTAVYSLDFTFPGTLYARMLSCPHANASIKSMDTSKAEAYTGVRDVLRYDNPDPAVAAIIPSQGYFEGKMMGVIIVADTDEIAQEALRLVEIEWDVLPFTMYPPEDQERIQSTNKGDIQQGFAEADQIIEFTYSRKEDAGHVEPNNTNVSWKDDHYEYAQVGQWNNLQAAQWFTPNSNAIKPGGVSQARGYQHPVYQGGSFGLGITLTQQLFKITAVLSQRTKRPVKLLCSLQQSYYSFVSSDCGEEYFKVGFKNDGTITAVQNDPTFHVMPYYYGLLHLVENTNISNLQCNSPSNRFPGANRPDTGPYRCEQRPPVTGLNLVTNHVAAALGMDPTEVALKNDGYGGEGQEYMKQFRLDHGFPDRDSLQECVAAAKEAIDFDNVWHAAGEKTLPDGRKHGIGFAWDHEWNDAIWSGTGAVTMLLDGTAQIIGNHIDVGLNGASTYCQVAAEELGLKFEDVYFKQNAEGNNIQLKGPSSSTNACVNGWIVKKACKNIRAQMLETATQGVIVDYYGGELPTGEPGAAIPTPDPLFPDLQPEDLDIKDSVIFEKSNPENKHTVLELLGQTYLASTRWTQTPFFSFELYNNGQNLDMPHRHRLCRQAHFCEVAVDTETGEIEVLKVVNVNDVGKALSPESVAGQQYGGSIMGISRGKHEEEVYDPPTGVRLNGNLLDYKVSTVRDCGPIDTIAVETALGYGPYGACGLGECNSDEMSPILGPAVQNAISVWIDDFPITPDKVLKALGKI